MQMLYWLIRQLILSNSHVSSYFKFSTNSAQVDGIMTRKVYIDIVNIHSSRLIQYFKMCLHLFKCGKHDVVL